jgi:hypothetical protein
VIFAYKLELDRSLVAYLIDNYLKDDATREAWHAQVASAHGLQDPKRVKTWPNIFGNGGGYARCLKEAGLAASDDADPPEPVKRMRDTLRELRMAIARASRCKPNALWPGSHTFLDRHFARLSSEEPDQTKRFNRVFAYLIETGEDTILTIHAQAQRDVARACLGDANFEAQPREQRDAGGYQFDGLLYQRIEGCDHEAGHKRAERAIRDAGWHVERWGVTYKIVTKQLQKAHPDEFKTVVAAREALQQACDTCDDVRAAVEAACAAPASRKRARE